MRDEIIDLINKPAFYPYVGNHVFFPMLLCLLHRGSVDSDASYWRTVFFVFSLVAVWEIVEVLSYFIFTSFVLFGTDNTEPEGVGDVVFLDLGNGILGIILGLLTLICFPPKYLKKVDFYVKWTIFLIFGAIYSHLCSYSFCRSNKCQEPFDFPWGLIANGVLIVAYVLGWMWYFYTDRDTAITFTINGLILLGAVSFRWQSTAITVYIASLSMIGIYSCIYLYKRSIKTANSGRTNRKSYEVLSTDY